MQTLYKLRAEFVKQLEAYYPPEEIESLFYILTTDILSISRLQAQMNLQQELGDSTVEEFWRVLELLKKQFPIQHILGQAPFYGFMFDVNKHTLIPRPETEELVHLVIAQEEKRSAPKILDIGTGSGCIAISLAKKIPHSSVHGIDISNEALIIATRNASKMNAAVLFQNLDVLNWHDWIRKSDTYDVIVSNPPYITPTEKLEMNVQVLDHEPHSALFVEDADPLVFYREIAAFAALQLTADGALYFEINQYLASETKSVVQAQGFSNVEILCDINGAKRILYCRR
ncbi:MULTISPECIES: peptide chain release factor N(5)-glutamine methyltransferase [Sphingobacterium]|uniref:peptide chain release factor N(5)-glutamine methyltransferase n=1 Tax=Sphingobacterium populi TaxID=1812824 RepID=A0ABW5UEZ3_9SPHI|nr:peptide chain release factor N(5)-glutamine methyltransferase [Sphingobacterium sp. CFCC 11742]